MPPIRTAIIGLSANATTSWASAAHLPYLLSARGRAKYQIVALCNSSVAAFSLPPGTRAYGSPEALAADPDVDLVVCATRVDAHHATSLPSVRAGKSAFVEWPLAQDAGHARELADAAAAAAAGRGVRSLVGNQGRFAPVLAALRDVLESGRVGKVLSSEARAFGGSVDREKVSARLAYFFDRAVGGNVVTIGFGHLFDQIQHILGDVRNPTARFQLQRPEVELIDPATKAPTGTVTSNVPDLIVVTGSLGATETVQEGATLQIRYRRGQPFKGEPGFVWTINGEKGEVRLTAEDGPGLHAAAYSKPVTLEVHDFAMDQVEQVDWRWSDWQSELPVVARSIGLLYDKFADGENDGVADGVPSFQTALHRHEQIEQLLSQWK